MLASLKPGKISHSRSSTAASRALRLRVSAEKPSSNFNLVVQYVIMARVVFRHRGASGLIFQEASMLFCRPDFDVSIRTFFVCDFASTYQCWETRVTAKTDLI